MYKNATNFDLIQVCAICLRDIDGENADLRSEKYEDLCKDCERHIDIAELIKEHMKLPDFKAPFKVRVHQGNNVAWCPHCTAKATVLTYNSAGATQIICPKCKIRVSLLFDGELVIEDLKTHSQIQLNNTLRAFDNALTCSEWISRRHRENGIFGDYHGSQTKYGSKATDVCVQTKISAIQKLLDRR